MKYILFLQEECHSYRKQRIIEYDNIVYALEDFKYRLRKYLNHAYENYYGGYKNVVFRLWIEDENGNTIEGVFVTTDEHLKYLEKWEEWYKRPSIWRWDCPYPVEEKYIYHRGTEMRKQSTRGYGNNGLCNIQTSVTNV